jgi:DNA-binding transcriptional regulator YhcF (GntR family)
MCANIHITDITKDGENMFLQIDFNSNEAIYIQLRNQIIIGIATESIREGDPLPSVRQMADNIGINMHTVNKAYTVLKQEGFVKLDRRKGAVVSLDVDKIQVLDEMRRDLSVVLARGVCKNVTSEEMHQLVDEIFQSFIADQREE